MGAEGGACAIEAHPLQRHDRGESMAKNLVQHRDERNVWDQLEDEADTKRPIDQAAEDAGTSDPVVEASEESFPASDAPAWTPKTTS